MKYVLHHINGIYFEIVDAEKDEYEVSFEENLKAGTNVIYSTKLKKGMFAKCSRQYLSDLKIVVRYQGRTIKQINVLSEMKGKRVFISFESKALGDTLAWIPYCVEFAKKYDCKVIVSTFKNFLFEKTYPELEFVEKGVVVHNIFAQFNIGWFWDEKKEPVNPILVPLQQTATNILNLEYKEIIADIHYEKRARPIEDKYVCISIYSTAGLKLWYYWQEVIDWLKERGYRVFEISKESEMMGVKTSDYKGLERLDDTSLESTINYLEHCEYYIGLSSGISWLAWALRKRVYMIANFTNPDHEFQTDCIRIANHKVCHGCWHNPMFKFDRGRWNWCPAHEDTPRQFECHKQILAKDVTWVLY